MAITEAYTGSASITSTEYSLPNASTTLTPITVPGIYQLFLDLNAMVAGDQYLLQIKEKVQSGGTQRVVLSLPIAGAQAAPHSATASLILLNGWDMTLTLVSATARTIAWSIRKVA